MKNMKMIIALVLVAVVGAAVAGGAVWYMSKGKDEPAAVADGKPAKKPAKKEEKEDKSPPKYLTVDKVIIMLKRQPGDTLTHYMSADLVITTTEKKEKEAKEQLPMLRSVAVRTLSNLPMATAQVMTIDQFAGELNKAFEATYEHEGREKPFSEVMIGKLIIE
ncbi:flagellar basal body-associated FliL family protein [Duganella sp. HH101]|uniref:flagellar basal body-associated FliL family protein n=1 Tax=Duganella sp. HH101 TaxID=1781066 RepID=UPI000893A223|nr:flagellar basal body-associated FliL family protein [Duganella sp. HH101]OEZ96940.1 flagellar basal body-associated protein FliL [Duganella sp. HH101]